MGEVIPSVCHDAVIDPVHVSQTQPIAHESTGCLCQRRGVGRRSHASVHGRSYENDWRTYVLVLVLSSASVRLRKLINHRETNLSSNEHSDGLHPVMIGPQALSPASAHGTGRSASAP